jgi:glycosyltransferase involved in cell wall biosynthesis
MNPKSIAIILGSLRTGGLERVMINLANGFASHGINCHLVVIDAPDELKHLVRSEVQVVDLNKKKARHGISSLGKYLSQFDPEIIIASQTHVQLMTCFAISRSQWKGKLILNEHSIFSLNNKSIFRKWLARNLFNRADAVVAVSNSVADNFKTNFPSLAGVTSVIYNAAFETNMLIAMDNFNLDTSIPIVMAAGRLVKSKNYKLLLNSFKIVLQKTNARLVILGEGPERNDLENQARKIGIDTRVEFLGVVENPFAYMKRCNVFVLSSDYEGLPTVLVEALACGCNIVSTDAGGAAEILTDYKFGKIVPLNDEQALSEAILASINEKPDVNAKIKRSQEFGIEAAVNNYLDLFQKLNEK